MKRTNVFMLSISVAGLFLFMSFIVPQEQNKPGPWDIPADYLKKTNPYEDNADMQKVGKMLWSKHCKSCHGNKGLGDGPKARQLETFPGDFSTPEFQAQSDGEMFYKSFVGRDEMPNYEKKIPDDEDQWALILYMRAMK
jgi:cytochrome c